MIKNGIWEGRFQPIHNGHLAYIALLLTKCETLWLFIVENEVSTQLENVQSPVPDFTAVVDKHHIADKNPLPFWLRYKIVDETIRHEFGHNAPIYLWGGRRLDLNWPFYQKTLPPERVFLTPERDEFEDVKAKAWHDLDEKVERIDVSHLPRISATEVRTRLRNGQAIDDLLNTKTIEILKAYDYLYKL